MNKILFNIHICDFLIKRCLKKHSCDVCTSYAESEQYINDRTLYTHFKAFSGNTDISFGSLYISLESFVSQMNKIFYERFEEFVI